MACRDLKQRSSNILKEASHWMVCQWFDQMQLKETQERALQQLNLPAVWRWIGSSTDYVQQMIPEEKSSFWRVKLSTTQFPRCFGTHFAMPRFRLAISLVHAFFDIRLSQDVAAEPLDDIWGFLWVIPNSWMVYGTSSEHEWLKWVSHGIPNLGNLQICWSSGCLLQT